MSNGGSHIRFKDLPAYLFDLLTEEERAELEVALEKDENAQEALRRIQSRLAQWDPGRHPSPSDLADIAARDSWEAVEHVLSCRDCAFELAVMAAGAKGTPSGRRQGRGPGPIWNSPWLRAVAVFAVCIGGFILGGKVGGPWMAPTADDASLALVLQAPRGAGETQVELRRIQGQALTLVVQAPIPPGPAAWELRSRSNNVEERVTGGALMMGQGPHLRDLALRVPKALSLSRGKYLLLITGADGEVIRQWDFLVTS